MAGQWIKWVKGLTKRREVIVLSRKLGISKREAACCCMEVWEWADDETCDGFIQGATKDDIDSLLGLPGFADAMESEEVGWARFNSRGVSFPRWDQNNGESAKLRAMESRKKRRQRDLQPKSSSRKCPDDVPLFPAPEKSSLSVSDRVLFFSKRVEVPEGFETPLVRSAIADWVRYKSERGQSYKNPNHLSRRVAQFQSSEEFISAVNYSIGNNYSGIFAASGTVNGNKPHLKLSETLYGKA